MELTKNINPNIFREYDVRGVYPTDLNEDVAYTFGKAFGTYIKKFHQTKCVIGHDNRLSSDCLVNALLAGVKETGIEIIYLGLVTTPMYYYACIQTKTPAGVMVTASHNPKDENGFKFSFDESGNARGEMIQEFFQFLLAGNYDSLEGKITFYDIKEQYEQYLLDCVSIQPNRPLKVIIDCGNGTTSFFAKEIYDKTNLDVTVLFGESDPTFPNHHPDPCVEENLTVLKQKVLELHADIGIAFDGDGDRVGVISEKGTFIPADQLMIIIARDILPHSANKRFLYDVKCTKALPEEIEKLGGTPVICRTGNSYTKLETREKDCIFGGEYSGHVYFRDKFLGFDSGLYAGLRLLEILSHTNQSVTELLAGIQHYESTPELKILSTDTKKKEVVEKIKQYCHNQNYQTIELDGVRVEFPDGWALIRYSNTGPHITARFEGATKERMETLQQEFMHLIQEYNS